MSFYKVKVKGKTPYMQHRMDDTKLAEWEKQRSKIIERDNLDDEPKKRALFHSYYILDDNEQLKFYIPSEHFKQSFIKGGGFTKGKVGNASRSMKNIVAGMWRICEEKIFLANHYDEIDSRSAVNNNVKARVMVHRPKWTNWEAEFTLEIDEDEKSKMTKEMVTDIIKDAGRYVGIGSYRPEHQGEFGRFTIESIIAMPSENEPESALKDAAKKNRKTQPKNELVG